MPPTANRPAVIFDFGNVVAFFDYERAGAILGEGIGLSGPAFLERARGEGFAALLKEYESGRLACEAFGKEVCARMGLEMTHDQFHEAWRDIFWLNEPVVDLAARIKEAGHRLVLGSNTNAMHATHYAKKFAAALEPFDALVFSHQVGHVKPSPEFYRACSRAAGVDAADCLFIDDLPENIEGAKATGMRGIVYRDVEGLRRDLRVEGVMVEG